MNDFKSVPNAFAVSEKARLQNTYLPRKVKGDSGEYEYTDTLGIPPWLKKQRMTGFG